MIVEERLVRARSFAALLRQLGAGGNEDTAPSPAFWEGLMNVAGAVEAEIAAVRDVLPVEATNLDAPDVWVE